MHHKCPADVATGRHMGMSPPSGSECSLRNTRVGVATPLHPALGIGFERGVTMDRRIRWFGIATLVMLGLSALGIVRASAQATPDPVGVQLVSAGHAKIRVTVTAGASGAPNGFEVCWMPASLFASYNNTWPVQGTWAPGEGWDDFTGIGTLNTWGQASVSFQLAPYQSLDIEVGDTYDETGVSGTRTSELPDAVSYVLCAYALPASGGQASALSVTLSQATTAQGSNCTFTVGYWKNHTSAWPVSSLALGTVTYSATDLLSILNQSVGGNGLVSLAHQLIAAKLNIAAGADPTAIASTISSADALIGGLVVPPVGSGFLSPSTTDPLTQALDDYNNGLTGPGHCTTPTRHSTWGGLKSQYR